MTDEVELERLRARLDRERRARRQAEVIAERGIRELWDANRDLHARVAERTALLETLVAGLDLAQETRLHGISRIAGEITDALRAGVETRSDPVAGAIEALGEIRLLSRSWPSVDAGDLGSCGPIEIADRLLDRWQRRAARNGQLLTVAVSGEANGPDQPWWLALAAAETIIRAFVRHGTAGPLAVVIAPTSTSLVIEVRGVAEVQPVGADGAVAASADAVRDVDAAPSGPIAPDLALADELIGRAGGSLAICPTDSGVLEVSAIVPRPA